jgi:hypothetical protein
MWKNHTEEQKQEIFGKLWEVYEKHGKPPQMRNPESKTEVINILH